MPKGKRKPQTDTNRGAVHYSGTQRVPGVGTDFCLYG